MDSNKNGKDLTKTIENGKDKSSIPLLAALGLILAGYFIFDPHTRNQTFQLSLTVVLCIAGIALFQKRNSELVRRILMLTATFSAIRFIAWRAFTLNLTSPLNTVVSILLFTAEVYAVVVLFLICLQNWCLTREREIHAYDPEYVPPVDVFICTYNESLDIVRRTAYGAKNIDYPNLNVYILDDGRRDFMMNLSLELGLGYITRPDNRNAKAGNINHALKQTTGEFVLILDADAIPCRTILKECMPYFADKKMAIVQTPHRFMNAAPIQRNLYMEGVLPHEQELFFQVSMVGKNYWNAAIFAGSAGVIRRSVLDELGGMSTRTVIEDCEFSMEVHQKGYKSMYIPTPQSIALCPESLGAYLIQQSRWAKGQTQMLMLMNPCVVSHLSFAQRVCYLSGNLYYLFGLPRLAFIVVPAVFLIFGFCATSVSWLKYSLIATPFLFLYLLAQNYTFENFRHTFWSDVYELCLAPYVAKWTVNTIIEPAAPKFDVTPKGTHRGLLQFDAHLVWVHILLLLVCLFAFGIGIVKVIFQFDVSGNCANLVWTAYNILILLCSVMIAIERPQSRRVHRVKRLMPVTIQPEKMGDHVLVGNTQDVSEYGARVMLEKPSIPFEKGDLVKLSLEAFEGDLVVVRAKVIRFQLAGNSIIVEMSFEEMDEALREKLIVSFYCSPDTWAVLAEPYDSIIGSLSQLCTTPLRVGRSMQSALMRSKLYISIPTGVIKKFVVEKFLESKYCKPEFKEKVVLLAEVEDKENEWFEHDGDDDDDDGPSS